jgi:8-oxo-dGTP pyrophosphatase MutT (NUDIX family)
MELAARVAELLARMLARATQPAPAGSVAVMLPPHRVGTTSAEIAKFLSSDQPFCNLREGKLIFDAAKRDRKTRSALLHEAASRLADAGMVWGWRDEQLDVRPLAGGATLATIERAACRALGIATYAVHMNAYTQAGELVVARRAANKPIDPGLWDNLVGGMIAAGESELDALAREAYEEAGLSLSQLDPQRGGVVQETRIVPEGYMVETIQIFDLVLPGGVAPRNLDGEIDAIETWPVEAVLDAIAADAFTLEAALVTLEGLARRCGAA